MNPGVQKLLTLLSVIFISSNITEDDISPERICQLDELNNPSRLRADKSVVVFAHAKDQQADRL